MVKVMNRKDEERSALLKLYLDQMEMYYTFENWELYFYYKGKYESLWKEGSHENTATQTL